MLFSIITPSFRNSQWLKLCIASVADQGVRVEHIIQDAGSDDGTLDWLLQDKRINVFVEKDAGMYDAINRGLRRASGEIIAHLNCDEQYLPGALQAVEQYFAEHPEIEVVFADAVAVDSNGDYLSHRKMLVPRLWQTWTFPLSTLTCATFFRRSIIDRGLFFDTQWRIIGDGAWVLRLLHERVRMCILRRFTSAFTVTGQNLSLHPAHFGEVQRFYNTAPPGLRLLRPLILAHHRLRRLLNGVYSQPPFDYEIYTQASPNKRVLKHVSQPQFRWRWQ